MASTARRGRVEGVVRAPRRPRGQTLRLGALCVFRQRVTPVAATKKMKTPYQNLRHEQHDVRREAPVVLVVDNKSARHPAGLQRRAPVAVGVVPERARRVRLGQVVDIGFARAGCY